MGSRLDRVLVDGMIQFDLFVHVDSPLLACTLVFPFCYSPRFFQGFQNGTKKSSPCGLGAGRD